MTLVTHSSAGGGSDVFLRDMTKYLKNIIDADFVVENVSGGSGAKAMAHMAKQKPDGSVFYATTPTYIYTSHMSELSANYTSLEPLVNVFYDPQVVYTRNDAPFKTLKDVIDHAKTSRSAWGAANPGSLERITLEQMKKITGVKAAIVTSEGGGETMINVLNGTLDLAIGEVQELRSQIEGKQIRVLAVLGEAPLAQLPDVPTAKDFGRRSRGPQVPRPRRSEGPAAGDHQGLGSGHSEASRRPEIQGAVRGLEPGARLRAARRIREVRRRVRDRAKGAADRSRRRQEVNRQLERARWTGILPAA